MRKMDKLSEAVWFNGRPDRPRKNANRVRYRENYDKIDWGHGKKKPQASQ